MIDPKKELEKLMTGMDRDEAVRFLFKWGGIDSNTSLRAVLRFKYFEMAEDDPDRTSGDIEKELAARYGVCQSTVRNKRNSFVREVKVRKRGRKSK